MKLFANKLPSELKKQVKTKTDDRILAAGRLSGINETEIPEDAGWAVACSSQLILINGNTIASFPWYQVAKGSWDPATVSTTVSWATSSSPTVIRYQQPISVSFLQLFKELVQRSVVASENLKISGKEVGQVAIRRTSAGELIEQIIPAQLSSEFPVETEELLARLKAGVS